MKSDFVGIETDLISSEAQPKISSEQSEDFIALCAISLGLFWVYESSNPSAEIVRTSLSQPLYTLKHQF